MKIFNSLMKVRVIVDPIRVSSKTFNNSYVFKKGDILSLMGSLKLHRCNEFLTLVSIDFNCKDLRANPFEEGEFHA